MPQPFRPHECPPDMLLGHALSCYKYLHESRMHILQCSLYFFEASTAFACFINVGNVEQVDQGWGRTIPEPLSRQSLVHSQFVWDRYCLAG